MKCPNCYSRKLNNKKCEMCGKDITTFQTKKNSIKKIITISIVILFLFLIILAIFKSDEIVDFINSNQIFTKIRNNYKVLLRVGSFWFFGILSVFLMMHGSYARDNLRMYESYLLGKIVDYRPSMKRGYYHPIIEYEVDGQKYRVVGKSIKTRELDGLVGVRYKMINPIESIIDGERNAELEFVTGLIMFITVLTIIMI